jgi:hypothetical protein
LNDLEAINESLRRALAVKLENTKRVVYESLRNLPSESHALVLNHTPHFLDKPDTTGFEKNAMHKMTGYNIEGKF